MSLSLLLLSSVAAQADDSIVITAAREPVEAGEAAVSSTLFKEETMVALALPSAADILRLSPGVSVATTGPRGTQTQLRIRGAEANHTLLFLDGIRFNDPATGNEARFELITSDTLSRIEIVRGPQSALWGSEALGGVVAISGPDPRRQPGSAALAEYGSLGSTRLYGRHALTVGRIDLAAAAGWQRSDGIDSFGTDGERDGFELFAGSIRVVYRAGPVELGTVGHWMEGRSEFDGFDPITFRRADTLDETRNRIGAVRGWAAGEWGDWSVQADASYLDSANRNRLAGALLNSTFGDRLTLGGQIGRRLDRHQLIAAIDYQAEDFRARDSAFFGGTDQDRSRHVTALVGEWRAEWSDWLSTDLAVRRDDFSAFRDATTWRASAAFRPDRSWMLHASYAEGIAQPTFFDLYGFFPGSFVGNPDLRPERSRGWETGLRWGGSALSLGVTYFSSRLRDEIVDTFDPETFLSSTANATGNSRRKGLELAGAYRHAEWLSLQANYTWLDADEQREAGSALVREVRRPRHSANLIAFGSGGRFDWGSSLAYVGVRGDTDFDLFPAQTVTLDDYWLASVRIAYRILPELEFYVRIENAFDDDYQDVVGYNSAGRTAYAGLRLAVGR